MKTITLSILIILTALSINNPINAQNMKLKIRVGNQEFTATLNGSEAAQELVKLLPLSVNMTEHNGNEKYYNLPNRMPGQATNSGRIEAGDLMIWSGRTLVLFYAGSRTSYSYISLGKIDNPSGLREAVGRGSVRVNFELIKQENEGEYPPL